jgi:Skp family chaperone for outer membrane proteins
MYKLIISFALLVSSFASAQMQIGMINPEEAMLQFQEYKEADARFNQFTQTNEKKLEQLREKIIEIENEAMNFSGDKNSEEFYKLIQRRRFSKETYESLVNDYLRDKNQRVEELLMPLRSKFYSSIEQIALEEGLSMVLHTGRVSDDLTKIIGENNFIDITELVIERANEN